MRIFISAVGTVVVVMVHGGLSTRRNGTKQGDVRCYVGKWATFKSYCQAKHFRNHYLIVKYLEGQLKEQLGQSNVHLRVFGHNLSDNIFTTTSGKRVFGVGKIKLLQNFIQELLASDFVRQQVAEALNSESAGSHAVNDASEQDQLLPESSAECSEMPAPRPPQGFGMSQQAMDKLELSSASSCPDLVAACEEPEAVGRTMQVSAKDTSSIDEDLQPTHVNVGKRRADYEDLPDILPQVEDSDHSSQDSPLRIAIVERSRFDDRLWEFSQ